MNNKPPYDWLVMARKLGTGLVYALLAIVGALAADNSLPASWKSVIHISAVVLGAVATAFHLDFKSFLESQK